MTQALTKEWYNKLQQSQSQSFINLPLELQLRGYDYNFISKRYLNFFRSEHNTRDDKLTLAKKFLKFIRSLNKNRAREELGTEFFDTLEYFYDNFPDLLSKQDYIQLETLSVLTEAIDKTQFLEDALSLDQITQRIKNLEKTREREYIIDAEWEEFEEEYEKCQKLLLPEAS